MRDRKAYFAAWHQANKERRNAVACARYKANREEKNAARRRARAAMTPEQREAIRAKDRAYRAQRKDLDQAYYQANRERFAARHHENYLRRKARAKKRDPIAAARRINATILQNIRQGYTGSLKPNHF